MDFNKTIINNSCNMRSQNIMKQNKISQNLMEFLSLLKVKRYLMHPVILYPDFVGQFSKKQIVYTFDG
jgi:hypothetical protein